jgi:cysteine/O-acetylserine efflux protein
MSVYVIGSFLVYCVINAVTPGPGNILALNTVTSYGWKKGKPLLFGIFTGYYIVQILCAVFVYGVNAFLPNIMGIIKYIGAAYILWLAFHIATGKPAIENVQKSASFTKGFILQFINVKIYMFGITALTGFITPYSTEFIVLLFFGVFIATMGTIATGVWIGIGALLQKLYLKYYRIINIILAITLLECVYSMIK